MSTLYVIGTPIGNLDDVSPRALEVLQNIGLLLCEDTRVTRRLLRCAAVLALDAALYPLALAGVAAFAVVWWRDGRRG